VKPPITEPARADNAEMYAMSMSLCRDAGARYFRCRTLSARDEAGLRGGCARLSWGRSGEGEGPWSLMKSGDLSWCARLFSRAFSKGLA
jgi:hypothetical protein